MGSQSYSWIWQDFSNLLDNFCVSRQQQQSQNATSQNVTTLTDIWQQLGIDWSSWSQFQMQTTDEITQWLGRYQIYLTKIQDFVAQNGNATIPDSLLQEINQLHPATNLTGLTYQ